MADGLRENRSLLSKGNKVHAYDRFVWRADYMDIAIGQDAFAAFDKTRDFTGKAVRSLCYAPFVSLYFESRGNVRVCCHNWKHTVGSVLHDTIDDIWNGARINILRDALKEYKFGPGCDFCHFRTAEGNFENVAMRRFDWLPVQDEVPAWPQQMEFSISNACNLECIMCTGLYSSAIRAHREKLPPMPRIYSDAFLESLRKYLPHLKRASFLGGEPFLVTEYYRLWDMMIADGLPISCHVTTNGTQYNKKVEKVLAHLPMSFSVSIDGATKATVESIRVNAKYEEVMENVRRFREYARSKGTYFGVTYCFMRQNWHELGEFCLMADAWDCPVYINTVIEPPQFGIYTLPLAELRAVCDGMEAQADHLERSLKKNRAVWFGEFGRVRSKCRAAKEAATTDA